MRQFGRDMQIIFKTVSYETPAGELISAQTLLLTNQTRVTKNAVVQGKDLLVTTELLGRRAVERFAIPEGGFLTQAAAERLSRDMLDKPGERVEVTILSLEGTADPFIPVVLEIVGPETIEAYGQAVLATKVISTMKLNGTELSATSWDDEDGPLVSRSALGGLSVYLRAAGKTQARRKPGKLDLTDISRIEPTVPLKNPTRAKRAVYRLKLKDTGTGMIDLPQTDMQKIIARGKDYLDVEVIRQDAHKLAAVERQNVPTELNDYLRSSLYLDWRTPSVKQAAEQIVADSSRPWDQALALWKYVDRTVFVKNLEVYFDPASNVLASHQGDCTEHAVLLAALARARGLPSRLVTGLTQVPAGAGRKAIFGYHAWTEVWIAGQWVALDAALRQAPVDVSHIAMGVTALNTAQPLSGAATTLLKAVGNLEIEVLEQN